MVIDIGFCERRICDFINVLLWYMLIVSPSISPLSYKSIFISLASVSILLTNAFSLFLNTNGAEGNILLVGLATVFVFNIVSVFGLVTAAASTFFTSGVVVFSGTVFGVVDGFVIAVDFFCWDIEFF